MTEDVFDDDVTRPVTPRPPTYQAPASSGRSISAPTPPPGRTDTPNGPPRFDPIDDDHTVVVRKTSRPSAAAASDPGATASIDLRTPAVDAPGPPATSGVPTRPPVRTSEPWRPPARPAHSSADRARARSDGLPLALIAAAAAAIALAVFFIVVYLFGGFGGEISL